MIFVSITEAWCDSQKVNSELNRYIEHMKLVHSFPCKVPQARIIKIDEILQDVSLVKVKKKVLKTSLCCTYKTFNI